MWKTEFAVCLDFGHDRQILRKIEDVVLTPVPGTTKLVAGDRETPVATVTLYPDEQRIGVVGEVIRCESRKELEWLRDRLIRAGWRD